MPSLYEVHSTIYLFFSGTEIKNPKIFMEMVGCELEIPVI
jgi:hypothetical protein